MSSPRWFPIVDGHEDLALNTLADGRDYLTSAHAIRGVEAEAGYENPNGICMLGLADWLAARVAVIFATVQTIPRSRANPGELSYAQYGLLFGLADGGELAARDLALTADLAPATVTQMLDSLAATGLVERRRPDHDKRVVLTALTKRGNALVAERRARFEPLWRDALDGFSDAELLAAATLLDRIAAMFDELAARPELD